MAKINVEIIGTKLYISGIGDITQFDVRSKGDYTSITEIIIENGPVSIKDQSFQKMSSLLTVHFSQTIESIGEKVFYQNNYLSSFVVDPESKFFYTDGKLLYNYNRTIFYKAIQNPGNVTLDPRTEIIMSNSLSSCKFELLNIPLTVKNTGNSILVDGFASEVRFDRESRLTVIPSFMFSYATITKLHIAPTVTTISSSAFNSFRCDEIIFDDINNSVCTTLMPSAFADIYKLSVKLPPCIISIPEDCFENSMMKMINIPRDCAIVSKDAFNGCTNLESITVDEGNKAFKTIGSILYNINEIQIVFISPMTDTLSISAKLEEISSSLVQTLDKVSSIDVDEDNRVYSGEDGCLYNKNKSILIGVCGGIKQLNISEDTELIGNNACLEVNITSVVFKGSKVSAIGENAFRRCSNLEHIDLVSSITKISDRAFQNSGLKSINLSNVNTLGCFCFSDTPLSKIVIKRPIINSGSNIFRNCGYLENVFFEPNIQMTEIYVGMFCSAGFTGAKLQIPKMVKHLGISAFAHSKYRCCRR